MSCHESALGDRPWLVCTATTFSAATSSQVRLSKTVSQSTAETDHNLWGFFKLLQPGLKQGTGRQVRI